LTGESEERETWTAESLRAASSEGQPFVEMAGRDFGGRRFWSTPMSQKAAGACGASRACLCACEQWWDLVNVAVRKHCYVRNVTGREKVLIQLESLILAQSERWRQA
jgi:hypothetical protein